MPLSLRPRPPSIVLHIHLAFWLCPSAPKTEPGRVRGSALRINRWKVDALCWTLALDIGLGAVLVVSTKSVLPADEESRCSLLPTM